jgi:ribosomal protein S18 acetylase RimI-like enzyme
MPWSTVRVRPATSEDLPVLLGFGEELRDRLLTSAEGKRGRGFGHRSLDARYLDALADPDRHLVVAVGDDDVPIGMALFSVAPASALLDLPALHMSHVVAADGSRRRGADKALVAAAAAHADEQGLDHVVVSVNPSSREANRFFARLGFAPLVVRRVAPVAVIRHRLKTADAGPVDDAVRRTPRRAVRLRGRAPALPLGPVDPEA